MQMRVADFAILLNSTSLWEVPGGWDVSVGFTLSKVFLLGFGVNQKLRKFLFTKTV
jgi:hypothetical protein